MAKAVLGKMKMMLVLILSVAFVLTSIPTFEVSAATTIGTVTYNGRTYTYTSLSSLVDDVEDDYKGKSITIEMLSDWGNERLVIPSDANVTLNMNGHIYNRGLSSYKRNGEVIYVNSGATLTVNGGDASTNHSVGVYTSTSTSSKASTTKTFSGAVIAGGYSSNGGGGIHIKKNATVTINNVTIAGCRAEQNWGSDGYGGGICADSSGITINLNNSTITGNYAYNDGGGIYECNSNNFRLTLKESHIDYNYCDDDGGGICIDGEKITVKGDKKSSVSFNQAGGSYGGGIYLWNDEVNLSGLTIEGNKISNGKGGGVYIQEETVVLSYLEVKNNTAKTGGGIYDNNDGNTLSNCTITGNTATERGGGVFVDAHVDITLDSKIVIKDNNNHNLFMSYVSFDLDAHCDLGMKLYISRNSDLYVYYEDIEDYAYRYPSYRPSFRATPWGSNEKYSNCVKFMTCENDGYVFTYSNTETERAVYCEKESNIKYGTKYEKADPTTISAESATPKTVGKYENTEYDLIKGYYTYPCAEQDAASKTATFYYSDGMFEEDPTEYNAHLATTSYALCMSGMYLTDVDYPYRHSSGRQFMADIGCDDQSIYVNDYNTQKPTVESIGVTIANKELDVTNSDNENYILIPVAVRGANYEAEWASNVTLGVGTEIEDGEAEGFGSAADKVMKEIENYIKKYNLQDKIDKGLVKFWVSGYSRAGATANLTCKRLVDKYGSKNQIYGYTCEAPQGGTDAGDLGNASKYYCIHNLINYADLVPLVAPTEMGFKRYGVDHYIPGSAEAGTVLSTSVKVNGVSEEYYDIYKIDNVTTYSDNEIYYTKTDNYKTQREKMLKQLKAIDSEMVFDDYFHLAEMSFMFGVSVSETGRYYGAKGEYLDTETYIRDLINYLIEASANTRDDYASKTVTKDGKIYPTIQQAARSSILLVFGMSGERSANFIERASSIMDHISTISLSEKDMINIYDDLIGDYGKLTEKKQMTYINFLWSKLKETGALDFLTDDEASNLEASWPTLADMLLHFTDYDYKNELYEDKGTTQTMCLVGTAAYNISRIMTAHYPEINLAWVRSYDSFYTGEDADLTEYKIEKAETVEAPSATAVSDKSKEVKLQSGADVTNTLSGNQKIVLDTESVSGEVIYYTLKDKTNNLEEKDQIYRGGIELDTKGSTSIDYQITATAYSHGTLSEEITYNVTLVDGRHKVTVSSLIDEDGQEKEITNSYYYATGKSVQVAANDTTGKYFDSWKVTLADGTDVTETILGEKAKDKVVTFTMPEEEDSGSFTLTYELKFEAVYKDKLDEISLTIAAPIGGQPLALAKDVTIGYGDNQTANPSYIGWSYTYNDEEHQTSGNAYKNTVYTAKIKLPVTEDMHFVTSGITCKNDANAKVTYNKEDNVIEVERTFDATGDEGSAIPEETKKVTLYIQVGDEVKSSSVSYIEKGTTFSIYAPDVENAAFNSFYTASEASVSESVITIDDANQENPVDEYEIYANYMSVPTKIEITVKEPSPDYLINFKPKTFKVDAGDDTYYIDPDCITYSYNPQDDVADFNTAYSLTMSMPSVQPLVDENGNKIYEYDEDGNVKKDEDGNPIQKVAYIDLQTAADDISITVNKDAASLDKTTESINYTFPATRGKKAYLIEADNPDDITVAHGTRISLSMDELPKTTYIAVEDESVDEANVKWISINQESWSSDSTGEEYWKATGEVILPDGVENPHGLDTEVEVEIEVEEAERADAPTFSRLSGEYENSFNLSISTDYEDAAIYYTTDGSAPTTSSTKYNGEVISVDRGVVDEKGKVTVRAITVKDGLRPSEESVFVATFASEITLPTPEGAYFSEDEGFWFNYNGESQTIVTSNENYTLSSDSSGVTIDDNGNAVAANAGTYSVTATLNDGLSWETVADKYKNWITVDGNKATITFKIKPNKVSIPEADELTYSGEEQDAFSEVDATLLEVTGGKATNAGSYTATVKLKDSTNVVFDDGTDEGTTSDQTVEWSIKKADQSKLIITTTDALKDVETVLETEGGSGDGAISFELENDTGKATLKNGKIYPVKAGKIYVTATKAGDSNYNEAKSEKTEIVIGEGKTALNGLTASAKASNYKTITVSWNKIEAADGYEIQRSVYKNSGYEVVATKEGADTLSFKNTVKTGKKYYYRVRPYEIVNGVKSYGPYSLVTAKTKPNKVKTLKIKAKSKNAVLKWSKTNGAVKYKIYRSTKKGSGYKLVKTLKSSKRTWTDTKVKKGKRYYYKVVAIANGTSGKASKIKSVKIK